jgi:hypothetical protein
MQNLFRSLLVVSTAAFLAACGGGGGGGSSSTPAAATPVASTATFQLRTATANFFQQSSTAPFTISGRSGSYAVTGSGSVTSGTMTSTTFEGQAALQRVSTMSGNVIVNGVSTPLSGVSSSYTDTNYLPIGYSGTNYTVVQGTANLPSTALVNDTAIVYTATQYANSTKSSTVGTETVTFSLLPDTANTALLKLVSVYRDNSSTLTSTGTAVFRVTPAGAVTKLSESTTYPNTNYITITY